MDDIREERLKRRLRAELLKGFEELENKRRAIKVGFVVLGFSCVLAYLGSALAYLTIFFSLFLFGYREGT